MTKASVYEILDPLSTIRKQRFWGWIDGTDISARWNETNVSDSGTFGMRDDVDQGFEISAGSATAADSNVNFNGIRQFDHQNSVWICIFRSIGSQSLSDVGFIDNEANTGGVEERATARNNQAGTFIQLLTSDGVASTVNSSDVGVSNAMTHYRGVLSSADVELFIDGVTKITNTTRLPDVRQQPMVRNFRLGTGGSVDTRFPFFEAYNT